MSAAILGKIFNLRKIPPHVKLVMLVLANNTQEEDGFCHMSRQQLIESTGIPEQPLDDVLRYAENLGLLALDPQPGDGMVLAWNVGDEQ